MSFAPPPDHSKSFLAVAIGGAIGLIALIVTRDQTPHVGDNIHHLPHGGHYRDGNKCISYFPKQSSTALKAPYGFWPVAVILTILCALHILNYFDGRRRVPCAHANQQI